MPIYALIIGIVLWMLGFLMIFGQLSFLISRYETFHKFIRRKDFSIDREGLSKFYSILYFVTGIPLLIGAIIGFINLDLYKTTSIWVYIAALVVGVIGIVYCNISNRFLKPLESIPE